MHGPPVIVSGEFLRTLIPETSFWDSLGPSYDRTPLVKALRPQWKVWWDSAEVINWVDLRVRGDTLSNIWIPALRKRQAG